MNQILNKRKRLVLKKVVEEYIKMAKPISSRILVKKNFPKLSSATIRNEMLALTKMGLLFQPYTSAGKIPTQEAFRFFLENFLKEKEIDEKTKNNFLKIIFDLKKIQNNFQEKRKKIKELAKELARQSEEAVLVAFSQDDYFYTGLSYLFSQPEFKDFSLISNLSEIIDHLDKVMGEIFDEINETKILLGEENPFGDKCATIFEKIKIDQQKIIIGLLGPLRMDYNKNLSLIKTIKKLFESI